MATTASTLPAGWSSREDVEIDLLLEAVYRIAGFDFRDYAKASLRRRIRSRLNAEKVETVTRLLDKIVHDRSCMDRFVRGLAVNVSAMFRDPGFFQSLRTHVVPLLRTWPYVRVWLAGCSTGEEAYSLAILLQDLMAKHGPRPVKIFATDVHRGSLERAARPERWNVR